MKLVVSKKILTLRIHLECNFDFEFSAIIERKNWNFPSVFIEKRLMKNINESNQISIKIETGNMNVVKYLNVWIMRI